ncbi:MAG: helix-turn-helix domain-containing protein [Bacillota bacterium]
MRNKREIYETRLPSRAIAIYLYLYDRTDAEGTCFPSVKTIARELNLSMRTVQRGVGDLVSEGYLEKEVRWRENGGRSSNLYRLV